MATKNKKSARRKLADKEEAPTNKNTITTTDRSRFQFLDRSKLPEEIIEEEILPRVSSAKTLARFRCVSRLWFSLINDVRFMNKHLSFQVSSQIRNYNYNILLFYRNLDFPVYSFQSYNSENFEFVAKFDCPAECLRVVGTCHGLVLIRIVSNVSFALLNPATGVLKKVSVDWPEFYSESAIYGLGYDPIENDYKVVKIYSRGLESIYDEVQVYSVSRNAYRIVNGDIVKNILYNIRDDQVFLDGCIYWLCCSVEDREDSILGFNLNKEVFELTKLPDCIRRKTKCEFILGELRGCISVMYFDSKHELEIWMMKKCGLSTSWNKQFTTILWDIGTPLGFGRDGRVLLSRSESGNGHFNSFVWYDLRSKQVINTLPQDDDKQCYWSKAFFGYVDRLAPIGTENDLNI